MAIFFLPNNSLSFPTGQTLIQIPHGDLNSSLSSALRIAHALLLTGGGKSPLAGIAPAGQLFTHMRQWVHISLIFMGSDFIFADVKIEVNLTLGPYSGVSSTLLCPKEPNPARYAACL